MQVIYKKLNDIKQYENNPRKNDEAVKYVAESIKEFGFKVPIVIDKDNVIVAGHTRWKAAKSLKIKEVPCIIADDLSEQQIKAYRLADNKVAEFAEWDFSILNLELDELIDFDMSTFGFEFDDDNEPEEIEEDDFNLDEALEEILEPQSKLGDIYQLGNHVLMCGDSTNEEDVKKLIGNKRIDTLLTDPPYNMSYSGAGFLKEGTKNCRERIKDIIDFEPEKIGFVKNLNIGSYYFFMNKDLIYRYLSIFKDYRFNVLTWCKYGVPPFINNNFYADIEYILYFHNGNRIWNNGLKPLDVYKKYYVSSAKEGKVGAGDLHPTMKPINLLSNQIKISSKEDGIVLDLFGGSGSTLIACEQLNRKCYMMELDPKYVDVIIKRWESLTGQQAVKIN